MAGWIILAAIVVLAIVLAARTAANRPREQKGSGVPVYADAQGAAERLAGAINFATVSYFDRSRMELSEFEKFHEYLEVNYPLVHRHLTREVTEMKSLIYYWEGRTGSWNRWRCWPTRMLFRSTGINGSTSRLRER
jgi:hypothetical protein